ncbi:hypothetical protein Misp01_67610 [Microtetraspora sp. NBRC 13810]|uniref:hypothetical protein n=1 Tax=Microtetraspora sp. NBRC 13810 TaxID=3030990 RepID=UPI0024A1A986|nr:hypothetical protein [Microtetraspora sp. NBRC 13810]GLW11633.1 hypothetical protein Misp01_67610 [Microtetraspora sp. NBRC 13810]
MSEMGIADRARRGAVPGAVAGLAGGVVFGGVMAEIGFLPTVAAIVRTDVIPLAFAVHMLFAAIIGAGFGLLVVHQRARVEELLFWGLVYGMLWWFLGPLTLLPILLGRPVAWDLAGGRELLPSLIGHLVYGAVTAAAFAWLRRPAGSRPRIRPAAPVRGLAAGALTAAVLVFGLGVMTGVPPYRLFVYGVVLGLGYPLLFGDRPEGTGPALIRGVAYGFAWWILVALTFPTLLTTGTLDWSLEGVRNAVPELPGLVLLGAGTAAGTTWLAAAGQALFEDDIRRLHRVSFGPGRLRAAGYGLAGGLAGGVVFALVLAPSGLLPTVARLAGGRTALTGLWVHLVIAMAVGVSYGVFFRNRSFDLASGLGWGVCYGFLWWILGGLTLAPVLLGGAPLWTAAGLTASFPVLVGHLAYGAVLGAVCGRLEQRVSPWWLTRGQAEQERRTALREQTLGSAPALWTFVLLIALTVPLLIAR